MPSSADGPETSVGSGSCLNQELLPLNFVSPTFIVPLDARRRERVSQLARCGEECFDSRRRVNSDVGRLLLE